MSNSQRYAVQSGANAPAIWISRIDGHRLSCRVNLSAVRNGLLLATIALYIVLNYGFIHIRGPFGIPIGEIVLLFALCAINHKVVFPKFIGSAFFIPLLLWWASGFCHLLWDVPHYGLWAIRDAADVIESLYLYVGFAYAGNLDALKKLARWLPRVLLFCCFYALGYPFRQTLELFSPTLSNSQGQPVSILFAYTNTAMNLATYSAYLLNRYRQKHTSRLLAGTALVIALALLLLPSRTTILQILLVAAFFFSRLDKHALKSVSIVSLCAISLIGLLLASDIPINGRFGADFEMQDYMSLFLEIFPWHYSEVRLSSGTDQRIDWWLQIIEQWKSSFGTILFGMGYGFPLIDFSATGGITVREPHNTIVGILARGGIISLTSFMFIQTIVIRSGMQALKRLQNHPQFSGLVIISLFIIFNTLIATLGESPFIMPFYAIPYYFVAGILLRLSKLSARVTDYE